MGCICSLFLQQPPPVLSDTNYYKFVLFARRTLEICPRPVVLFFCSLLVNLVFSSPRCQQSAMLAVLPVCPRQASDMLLQLYNKTRSLIIDCTLHRRALMNLISFGVFFAESSRGRLSVSFHIHHTSGGDDIIWGCCIKIIGVVWKYVGKDWRQRRNISMPKWGVERTKGIKGSWIKREGQ